MCPRSTREAQTIRTGSCGSVSKPWDLRTTQYASKLVLIHANLSAWSGNLLTSTAYGYTANGKRQPSLVKSSMTARCASSPQASFLRVCTSKPQSAHQRQECKLRYAMGRDQALRAWSLSAMMQAGLTAPGIGLTLSLYPTCASSRATSRSFCSSKMNGNLRPLHLARHAIHLLQRLAHLAPYARQLHPVPASPRHSTL